jgi:hypothetical protein
MSFHSIMVAILSHPLLLAHSSSRKIKGDAGDSNKIKKVCQRMWLPRKGGHFYQLSPLVYQTGSGSRIYSVSVTHNSYCQCSGDMFRHLILSHHHTLTKNVDIEMLDRNSLSIFIINLKRKIHNRYLEFLLRPDDGSVLRVAVMYD